MEGAVPSDQEKEYHFLKMIPFGVKKQISPGQEKVASSDRDALEIRGSTSPSIRTLETWVKRCQV